MHETAGEALPRIAGTLQRDPRVESVWLAGSLRDGLDDEVSDVDLWIVSSDWSPGSIDGLFAGYTLVTIGGSPLLHGIEQHGVLQDLRYGPQPPPEYVMLEPMEPK